MVEVNLNQPTVPRISPSTNNLKKKQSQKSISIEQALKKKVSVAHIRHLSPRENTTSFIDQIKKRGNYSNLSNPFNI